MNEATRTHLRICTFKELQNLAMYAAQEQGLFAAQNLVVEIEYTTGSKPQLAGLARGETDVHRKKELGLAEDYLDMRWYDQVDMMFNNGMR